jgi:D-alanine-D-alanine ligase
MEERESERAVGLAVAAGDLEEHLPPDWWKTLFTETYLKTDGDVTENDENTKQDVDILLGALRLEPRHAVLDLCCGQGRHCIELARRGFGRVTGLDYSDYLLPLARRRAAARSLAPPLRFLRGDARMLPFGARSFDAIISMGNSFGYFADPDDDVRVVAEIAGLLREGGQLFLDLTDGELLRKTFAAESSEWLDEKTLVSRERTLTRSGRRLVSREVVRHRDRGILADQIYAETLYAGDDIRTMLEQIGFTDIRLHPTNSVLSTRNEDLGMLAHRLIVTASRGRGPR